MSLTDYINNLYDRQSKDGELAQLSKLYNIEFAEKINEMMEWKLGGSSRTSVSLAWLDKRPYACPVGGFRGLVKEHAGLNEKVELADAGVFVLDQSRQGAGNVNGSAILLQAKVSDGATWDDRFFKLLGSSAAFTMRSEGSCGKWAIIEKPKDRSSIKEWYLLVNRPAFYLLPGPSSKVGKNKQPFFCGKDESPDREHLAARIMYANKGRSFSNLPGIGCHWVSAIPADYPVFNLGLGDLLEKMAEAYANLNTRGADPAKSFTHAVCDCADRECLGATPELDDWSRLCGCILKLSGESATPKMYFDNQTTCRVLNAEGPMNFSGAGDADKGTPAGKKEGFLAIVIRILRVEE